MYNPHFGLEQAPFKITPNTEFFFHGGNRGAILEALSYAIKEGEGIIKVVGEVGSGKTMICRMLQSTLPESIETVYLAIPSVAPEHVLKAIAYELNMRLPKDADRLKILQRLQSYLLKRHAKGQQTVLFVEEAQAMPIATLEEIRLLSNLETNQDKLLQIVLFGQPELDENLEAENIRQLRDRITHSFNLGPFEADEIGEYLSFRLRAAGYHGPELFTTKSIKKIARASEGLLRRVNILADKSLLSAFSENAYQVLPKHVNAAIQDSEFAPKSNSRKGFWLLVTLGALLLIIALVFTTTANKQSVQSASGTLKPKARSIAEIDKEEAVKRQKQIKPKAPQTYQLASQLAYSKAMLKHMIDHQHHTIQMLTAKNDKDVDRVMVVLAKQLELPSLFLIKKQAPSKATIILYGDYANASSAATALALLPNDIKSHKPFLTTFNQALE